MPDDFGTMPDGRTVRRFWLQNDRLKVAILEFGAAIQSIETADRSGVRANVVLGLTTLEAYRLHSPHFGAVPGRAAGRIANGRFTLDGVEYQLPCNAGAHCLHGGPHGFGKRVWSATDHGPTHVTLRLVSADGDAGFPGEVDVTLRYSLKEGSLALAFSGTTTRPTILNLTNHSYFNLAGEGSGSVLSHVLRLEADEMLPNDGSGIPTGERRDVTGTPFDFRQPRALGEGIRGTDPQLLGALGYDHCVMLRGTGLRPVAVLHDPVTGRRLTLSTTEPAVQLYTGNNLTGGLAGPSGRSYRQSDAVCLEAQHPPDSINHPGLPQSILRPGERYRASTVFAFDTVD